MGTDFLKAKREREAKQASQLQTAGYIWKKRETQDSYDPDEPQYERYLVAPDGIEVSVFQALDEIARGREVVRAELHAKRLCAEERNRQKRQAREEAQQREEASIKAFSEKVAEVKATCIEIKELRAPAIEWETVVCVESTSDNRAYDMVRKATIDGRIVYEVVAGTYKGDEIYPSYWVEQSINYSADDGSGDAERITPDPAGETWTPEPAPRTVDLLRTAWHFKMTLLRLYGRYATQTVRAFAVFEALFADNRQQSLKACARYDAHRMIGVTA